MSFLDLELGRLPPPSPWKAVEWGVFQVNTKVATLRQLAAALGTPRDTPVLRDRLRRARAEAMRQAKNALLALRRATAAAGSSATGSKSNLATDLESALRELHKVLNRIAAAERKEASGAAAAGCLSRPGSPPLSVHGFADQQRATAVARQELVFLDSEITFNEAVIAQREQGILEVQRQITEINGIFRDLATLVQGQGECVNAVESNLIGAAEARSQEGEELSRALQSETKEPRRLYSYMKCLLLVVLGLGLALCIVFARM